MNGKTEPEKSEEKTGNKNEEKGKTEKLKIEKKTISGPQYASFAGSLPISP